MGNVVYALVKDNYGEPEFLEIGFMEEKELLAWVQGESFMPDTQVVEKASEDNTFYWSLLMYDNFLEMLKSVRKGQEHEIIKEELDLGGWAYLIPTDGEEFLVAIQASGDKEADIKKVKQAAKQFCRN